MSELQRIATEREIRIKHGLYNPLERRGVRIHGTGNPHIFKVAPRRWCCRNRWGVGYAAKPHTAYRAWRRDVTELCIRPNAPWRRHKFAMVPKPPPEVRRMVQGWLDEAKGKSNAK